MTNESLIAAGAEQDEQERKAPGGLDGASSTQPIGKLDKHNENFFNKKGCSDLCRRLDDRTDAENACCA